MVSQLCIPTQERGNDRLRYAPCRMTGWIFASCRMIAWRWMRYAYPPYRLTGKYANKTVDALRLSTLPDCAKRSSRKYRLKK